VVLEIPTFANAAAAGGMQMLESNHECIDPNGGFSRSLEKLMQNKKLVL
jgi:hypothetical protein